MATKRYKRVRKLSVAECAYLAGIVDGEGSITLTVKQKGGTRHLAVLISSTDRALLEYARKVIGAGMLIAKRIYQPHHHAAYAYSVYSRQALNVLKQIAPYLRTYKSRRAKLALAQYVLVTPRNGKYDNGLRKRREKFVKRFFSIMP